MRQSEAPLLGSQCSDSQQSIDLGSSQSQHDAPVFTYSQGDVEHDENSARPRCCKRASKFRVYLRQNDISQCPRGICCGHCDTEFLDRNEYESAVFDEGCLVTVTFLDASRDTDFESSSSSNFDKVNVNMVTLHKKVSKFKLTACSAWLTMVSPNRRYIDHRNINDINKLKSGDHIMWHRPYTLWHHQLIKNNKGNGTCDVIHFDTSDRGIKGEVKYTRDFDFTTQTNGTAYKIIYDKLIEDENSLTLVLDRANSKLTDKNYRLFRNNCEHLITFCKTGTRRSLQSRWLILKICFLVLRVLILSFAICMLTRIEAVNHYEREIVEFVVVFVTEVVVLLSIFVWHLKQYRTKVIGLLDCTRRIFEAVIEAAITIAAYALCIFVIYVGTLESLDVSIGIVFGVLGKVIGCLFANAVVPCLLRPRQSEERDTVCTSYGATGYHHRDPDPDPTCHSASGHSVI